MACKYNFIDPTKGYERQEFNSSSEVVEFLANMDLDWNEYFKDNYAGIPIEIPMAKPAIEQNLVYVSDRGNRYSTYKQALQDSSTGDIQIGVDTKLEGFKPLLSVSSNTNPNQTEGFINLQIKQGLLSDTKYIQDGKSYHQAAGNDQALQLVNEALMKEDSKEFLGPKSAVFHRDGRIEFKDNKAPLTIDGKNISKAELNAMSPKQIQDKFDEDTASELITDRIVKDIQPAAQSKEEIRLEDENALSLKLLDLLNVMGVKVITLQKYVQNYNTRNGVDPSAKALVDIANQVVAFRDGLIETDALTEETAHFIVEAWDQTEIQNLIASAHKTDSYQQHAEHYRELYRRDNPDMSSEEIEDLVRREVLGKELSRALQNRFQGDNLATETQKSIWRFMYDKMIAFFNNIIVQDDFRRNLEKLTLKVEDLLLSKDISQYLNINQTRTRKFNMYQSTSQTSGDTALDAKATVMHTLVRVLMDQEKSMIRAGSGSRTEVQKLQDKLEQALTKASGLELIKLAKRHAVYLSSALESAKQKGQTLNNEEGIVLHNMKYEVVPILERLKVLVHEDSNLKSLEADIDAVLSQMAFVKGDIANTETKILDRIIDRLMIRHNAKPEDRAKIQKAVENASRDTQMLYSWFGQITHANDPLLGLLGSVIADMNADASRNYMQRTKTFQNKIEKAGFAAKDLAQFYTGDGYIVSPYDWARFEKDIVNKKAELYKQYSGSELSVEELAKKIEDKKLPDIADRAKHQEYKDALTQALKEYYERPFTDEYYKKREERQKDLSTPTRVFLNMYSSKLGELMSSVRTEKGLPRYRLQDKYNLDALNLERRAAKSFFDEQGRLKKGIVEHNSQVPGSIELGKDSGKFYSLDKGLDIAAREEATVAFELNKLDQQILQEKVEEARLKGFKVDTDKLAPKFLEELDRIEKEEGRDAAVEFFTLNTTVGFSNDFWDNQDSSQTVTSFFKKYTERADADPVWVDAIENFQRQQEARKAVVKRYQDSRNYTNTLASEIPSETKEEILRMTEDMDRTYQMLWSHFKDEIQTMSGSKAEWLEEDREYKTESEPNQAFFDALADENLTTPQEQFEYALKHMTADSKRKVRNFSDALDDLLAGKYFSKNQELLVSRLSGLDVSDITPQIAEELKLKYAQTKLAPYYKSFAPAGLSYFYRELKEGAAPVIDLVEDLNSREDIKVGNNISYYDMGEIQYKNPNYRQDFEGGGRQPRLSKYVNQKYVQMFGQPAFDADNKIANPSGKNQKLFDLYKDFLDYHAESLKAYGETGNHNLYLAPQISKSTFQKIQSLVQGQSGTLKDLWQDATRFRVDELAMGEELNGESLAQKYNVRVLPKYFMRKLEAVNDVSNDLFHSAALFAQQAELYKARSERFSEFAVLHDKVLNRTYPDGKAAEATNTYKMFKSYMDSNLFGIREMKQWRVNLPFLGVVDVTKIIDMIHSWVKNNSLAYNVVVPITSWLTAESTLFLEKYIGQYIDPASVALGSSEFRKLSTDAIKEGMEINSTSKLSIMGEYFGIFNMTERFENSIYSKTTRLMGKGAYGLHTMANFTPLSRAMMSQLYGNRLFGDKLVDFKKFTELKKALEPGVSETKINAEWTALESKTLYSYLNITKDNTVSYNYDKLAQDMGRENDEQFQADFRNMELGLITKIKKVVERIDGQIRPEERTMMTRSSIGRYLTTHKGWLSIAAANRFKRRHYNFQTGQEEEGSYISIANQIIRSVNSGVTKEGFKGALKELKNLYKNGNETDRQNIKRVMIEMGFLTALYLITMLMANYVDDDDELKENRLAQMTTYLFERTLNETSSSQIGVLGEFWNSAESPVVGLTKIQNAAKVWDVFDTDVVKRGRYKGLTKQETYFVKNFVGAKSFYDLYSAKNLATQRASYNFFNQQEAFIPISYFINEETFKEDEEQ